MGKTFSFVSGALFGAAAGAIVGVALAPRSGAETRAMAADIANDAWDNMRDTYELNDAISGGNVTPAADVVVENAVEADTEAAEPSTEA